MRKPTRPPTHRPPLAQTLMFAAYGVAIWAEIIGGAYLALDRYAYELTRADIKSMVRGTMMNYDQQQYKTWEQEIDVRRGAGGYDIHVVLTPPADGAAPGPRPADFRFRADRNGPGSLGFTLQRPGGQTSTALVHETTAGERIALPMKRFGFVLVPIVLISLFVLVVWAKLLSRAGYPQFYVLLPGVNVFYTMRMAVDGLPKAWLMTLGLLVPGVNSVVWILASLGLAKRFGRSAVVAVGLILLPVLFLPVIAFGKAPYLPARADD